MNGWLRGARAERLLPWVDGPEGRILCVRVDYTHTKQNRTYEPKAPNVDHVHALGHPDVRVKPQLGA